MDYQSLFAIIFILLLSLFLYFKRDKLIIQKILHPIIYFVMYRTRLGLKWMDILAKKYGTAIRAVASLGIIIGFLGMIFISYELVSGTLALFLQPETTPGIKPVLPFAAKGVFFVPFFYWITSIFIIAIAHEFAHGVAARAFAIKVKSSGFAFLGIVLPIIPAAFVEPDEKQLAKKSVRAQLAVFAAGPFANILLAGILFLTALFIINPFANNLLELTGAKIMSITPDGPAHIAGLTEGELIQQINTHLITTVENFTAILAQYKPGDAIKIKTNASEHTVYLRTNTKNESKPFLGVSVAQATRVQPAFKQKYGETTTAIIIWLFGLVYWLLLLNLGIGLFNLLPLGPVDGGRMFHLALQKISPKHGVKIWKFVSILFFFLILANVITGFLK